MANRNAYRKTGRWDSAEDSESKIQMLINYSFLMRMLDYSCQALCQGADHLIRPGPQFYGTEARLSRIAEDCVPHSNRRRATED